MAQILVVDDDEVTRNLLKEVLEKQQYSVQLAASGEEAISKIKRQTFAAILTDIRMMEMDGMAVLRAAKKVLPQTAVILMTGFGNMEGAIAAIQEGAFDYISKPFKMNELKAIVARATKYWESLNTLSNSAGTNTSTVEPLDLANSAKGFIGKSARMLDVFKTLARASMSTSTVLITGESGTGKELVARAIHEHSQTHFKKFIAVNCGALSENLLESELFGHVRGAFTGASADKSGLFEEANGGTLFLDEIGDVSLTFQIKLLRVLQEREIKPVGSSETRKINVRVVAATHRDLEGLVKIGKFREDLYYRLKVISIDLPPLRERMDDLPYLVEHFLSKYSNRNKKLISHISEEAMALMSAYSWPGNIRELEHSIERAVAMANTAILFPEDFPPEVSKIMDGPIAEGEGVEEPRGSNSLLEVEKAHILSVLENVKFNKSRASAILGIDRATLYRKAQRLGINMRGKLG